ncbi:MAG: hypothetical protein JWM89_290 [Acidimicrobiales bacterium]|nr:hypothetical protein [Acidimicrobiales bacterium]
MTDLDPDPDLRPGPGADLRPDRWSIAGYRWSAVVAALAALGLGAVGAVLLVVGHHPWDGRVVETLRGTTHGLHRGDVLSIIPAVAASGLAMWCLRQGRVRPRRDAASAQRSAGVSR